MGGHLEILYGFRRYGLKGGRKFRGDGRCARRRVALDAWLAIRGADPGPILAPVSKGGRVHTGEGGLTYRAA